VHYAAIRTRESGHALTPGAELGGYAHLVLESPDGSRVSNTGL